VRMASSASSREGRDSIGIVTGTIVGALDIRTFR
jgi:hypothetical protein